MSEARAGWRETAVNLPLTPQEADEIAADDDPEPVEIRDEGGQVIAVAYLTVDDDGVRVSRLLWDPDRTTERDALRHLDRAFADRPR
jgi:hypothetical protein